MYSDEKIAMLERYRRQTLRAEEAEREEAALDAREELLTLEEAIAGIEKGVLKLHTGETLEFENRVYFEENIPVPIFKNFYQASEEGEESAVFVNHDHELSQTVLWLRENIRTITMDQWANLLVNGMARNNLFARVLKKKQLENMEYLCYEVPSGKGWIYNVMFRMKGKDKRFTGTFNCMKKEKDTYGIVLEAMVWHMDQWFGTR